ncbi:hypothetical protein [Chitinophaga solisilvae]|uniref:hypothetical protein n=1 Tax=Chitinophaga solisilvae TaxID=1233460 RepID=UPI00136DF6B1|nr:hypothetical protein [Chitinophaga solisilvae]
MSTQASLTVYLQALGGKFLGQNAYYPDNIGVILEYSGGTVNLPYQVTDATNDGILSPAFVNNSSSVFPVITPIMEGYGLNFLAPDTSTIYGVSLFTLPARQENARVTVNIPGPAGYQQIQWPIVLSPAELIYYATIIVPGLLVGGPEFNLETGMVSIYVKMMCGCQITVGPDSYWLPNDFAVYINVDYGDSTKYIILQFDTDRNNSTFTGYVPDIDQALSVNFNALQASTGNTGVYTLFLRQ